MESPKESKEKDWGRVADELDLLQKDKNQGRGVSCAKDIINHLKRGDIKSAKSVASWDHDKIREYPDIEDFLEKNVFGDDQDSPVKTRKRLVEKLGWKNE